MDYDIIANQPVVIDNGSGVIKAGFAGGQSPKVRFANFVGRPKHTRVMAGALEGDIFIGPKAEEYRGLLSLKYPMEHGIVTDWNDMEKVWQYIYSQEQLHIFPEEHPVLLTEAPLNPLKHREKAAEIFFESFNAPALHIQMQAVLSLYSTGRTTGVVLDSGDGVTHVVPIFEGFAMQHGYLIQVFHFIELHLHSSCFGAYLYNKIESSVWMWLVVMLPDGSVFSLGRKALIYIELASSRLFVKLRKKLAISQLMPLKKRLMKVKRITAPQVRVSDALLLKLLYLNPKTLSLDFAKINTHRSECFQLGLEALFLLVSTHSGKCGYSDSFPTVNNEDWAVSVNNESAIDELVVHPSISFRGRSRRSIIHSRAISGLSPEFLDDKAADAIFTSQSRMGSPAPPTPEQYEQIFSITNKAKTLIEKSRIVGKHLGELQQGSNALVARRQRIFPPNTVVIPFDSNINPEFPADAPRARGLINVPKGWNYNRQVDMEFQAGYKWRSECCDED
uniref:Actin n=1 Tax=Heterorhabditis bacteriophora TaxID=37862 RepID=A0A1I7XPW3_HETBA